MVAFTEPEIDVVLPSNPYTILAPWSVTYKILLLGLIAKSDKILPVADIVPTEVLLLDAFIVYMASEPVFTVYTLFVSGLAAIDDTLIPGGE